VIFYDGRADCLKAVGDRPYACRKAAEK
jgi:hypothetical protein